MIEQLFLFLKSNLTKLYIAVIPAGFFFLTANETLVVQLLFITLAVDVILGMTLAIKVKRFSSAGMGKVIPKFIAYGMAIITLITVAKLLPLTEGLLYFVVSFFILRELTSNIELLSLLGIRFPERLMALLNEEHKEKDAAIASWIEKNSFNKL